MWLTATDGRSSASTSAFSRRLQQRRPRRRSQTVEGGFYGTMHVDAGLRCAHELRLGQRLTALQLRYRMMA